MTNKTKYYLKQVAGLVIPTKANPTDAGYDVIATSDPKIVGRKLESASTGATTDSVSGYYDIDYVEYETNLYLVPDSNNVHTDLRPRSSISSKTNFVLANSVGLIDAGYHDQVLVRFKYIWQPIDLWWGSAPSPIDFLSTAKKIIVGLPNVEKMYKKGDKIAQILPSPTIDIAFVTVPELPGENRGGGFGSTDKKSSLEDIYSERLKQP
jgi:dUTPase